MTTRRSTHTVLTLALLAIGASILAAQLLAPPFIGLADNGDFPKVAGPLSLGPRDGPQNFIYFVPDYIRSPRYHWNSQTLSTERPLAWLATKLAGVTKDADPFDIRWLGACHAILFLCAVYALLRCRRPLIAAVAIGIFTDVNYVAYFNSFYTDTAALLGLLLMIPLAVDIASRGSRTATVILFSLAALLFIGSKPQHAIWGFLPAAFLARTGRIRGLVAAAILLTVCATMFRYTPPDYTAAPLFTLVFSKLTLHSSAPQADLAELGLPAEDSAFIGMHAFLPGAPILDRQWLSQFERQINYRTVLNWYLHHPLRMLAILDETLTLEASRMRAPNLSNFRRQDGHPAGARTDRFALWSDFRSALLRKWPHHILAWYLLVIAGSIAAVRRQSRLAWIVLGIATLAIGEFCVAALADAAETHRHLFIFHACTDLTICFAIAAALTALQPDPPGKDAGFRLP